MNKKIFVVFLAIFAIFIGVFANSFLSKNTNFSTNGLVIDNGDLNINWGKYPSKKLEIYETTTINASGTYELTGNIENGLVIVDVGDENGKCKLILNNLTIKNSNGPAIVVKSADDIVIELAENSINNISDGKSYSSEFSEYDGAIFSQGDLTITGSGKLNIFSNYLDGIVSKDDLTIRSGDIFVSSNDDAIRGKDSVRILDGKISIESKMDGIKSTNAETNGKGFVMIEDGEIEIDAVDDGIHASSHLIILDGKINIKNSYEGMEGTNVIINNGDINIVSSDDGINAAGGNDMSSYLRQGGQNFAKTDNVNITINGGSVYINASGDGIDSNGNIYFNGGKVAIDGPANGGNGALDAGDNGNGIYYSGGDFIACGWSTMAANPTESSAKYSVSIYFPSENISGTKITVFDTNGKSIIEHTAAKKFNHIVIGSEIFEKDKQYIIYVDDEVYESFTMNEKVVKVGETQEQMQFGPMAPNNGNQRSMNSQDKNMPNMPNMRGN